MKDKNKKLMLIVSILVLGIGLTFAYFVVGVNILGNGGSTKLATADLIRVKYDAGTGKLATSGLNPGHSTSKGFKVTVTPTKTVQEVTYRIFLNITSNTFEVCSDSNYNSITNDCEKDAEELIYILKDGNGNEIARGDLTDGIIGEVELARETKKVATETDYNYTIEIEFKDTNKDQNHNQTKTIQGEVKVEFAEPDTSDLNIMAVYVEKEDKPGKYDSVDQIPIGKSLDITKSYCEVNGKKIDGIKFNYDYDNGKMGVNNFVLKGTKCYIYFDQNRAKETLIKLDVKNIKEGIPDFTKRATEGETANDNGVFETYDSMYGDGAKAYYWRGAATTNHVIFDNKCWRIVRINGDGSIRLIYNGVVQSGNVCAGNGSNSDSVIMGSSDSERYYATSDGQDTNPSYVGWTYILDTQRTLSGTESNIKIQTEKWYNSNISTAAKEKVDDKGKFCNDRNIGAAPTGWTGYGSDWVLGGKKFAYAAAKRVVQSYAPTLSCDVEDTYELNVGAITSDEVQFAGASNTSTNTSYYLYNGSYYWTMTPRDWDGTDASMFGVGPNGNFFAPGVDVTSCGLRPVINLRSDVTINEGSDGTQNNPYIVQ